MSFDYSAAKAALKEAGHVVSTGPHVLASDIKELVSFGRRNFGLKASLVRRGINNTALLPKGFPGVASAPADEAAPVVAPAVAEDAPKGKKKAAVAEAPAPAPVPEPAQETKAQDAPAGEQAAQ
jgi:hypothetical protein